MGSHDRDDTDADESRSMSMQLSTRTMKIVLGVVLVLLILGLIVFIFMIEKDNKKEAEKEKQKAKERAKATGGVKCTPDMCQLTSNDVCIPAEPFTDAKAYLAHMNQPAYNALAQFKPDLMGIPRVGQPFQVAIDLSNEEVEVVTQALFEGYQEDVRDTLTVFRTRQPPALLAFRVPVDPDEAPVLFCDAMMQDCTGKGVDMWVARTEFAKFPKGYCSASVQSTEGTTEMAERVKAVANASTATPPHGHQR